MKFFKVLTVLFLVAGIGTVCTAKVPSVFGVFFSNTNTKNEIQDNSVPEKDAKSDYSVIEDEFTKLRIEYIKNQILKKLRLKEKPTITISELPKPVKEYENLLPSQDMNLQSSYSDDFYGKTTQAIIFPYEDKARCSNTIRFPSACLPFQMPNDIHTSEVASAELWFHKEKDFLDEHNQTFVIYEVAHWDTKKSFQKTTPIAIQETSLTEGWLKIDVTYVVKNWLDFLESPVHAINVVCKTCDMEKNQSPISFTSELKPFLVIYTHSQQRRAMTHRRQKRYTNCDSGITECCRESLYISFTDIGWNDWIIKPEGYNAYFCKGSCTTAAAMTLSASQHNSILQKVMKGHEKRRTAGPEITPCCAAKQFQPLQLVYMDSNKTLTTKLLSNMIVESCGCM
ncbi:growth/differentiation factor 8 [Diabrotica virgifera virgifera]|uniref:Growth/differentiation factor 8-like n=1 Tax=Diabrotica virgifera virgifera TaxID=50390 RepID=A0A6P7G5B4_DIAVI|nr:growth/differentiation factor 8 [Diabrotica virgifera virgifera]